MQMREKEKLREHAIVSAKRRCEVSDVEKAKDTPVVLSEKSGVLKETKETAQK